MKNSSILILPELPQDIRYCWYSLWIELEWYSLEELLTEEDTVTVTYIDSHQSHLITQLNSPVALNHNTLSIYSYCCLRLQCGYETGLSWGDGDLHLPCQPRSCSRVDCWAIISGNDTILFLSTTPTGRSMNCNDVAAVQCADFNFVATFTNTANYTTVTSTLLADMTSTLLSGTVVQCKGETADGTMIIANSTLNVAGTVRCCLTQC